MGRFAARQVLAATIALATLAFSVSGARCAAAEPGADAPRVWAHLETSFIPSSLRHNRYDWPLGLGLERWPGLPYRVKGEEGLIECRLAADAGIDAFAIDLYTWLPPQALRGTFGRYVRSASEFAAATGRLFYAAPCLYGLRQSTGAQIAAIVDGLCRTHAASPAWPKLDGRPIVWACDGGSPGIPAWQEAFRLLEARGCRVAVVLDPFGSGPVDRFGRSRADYDAAEPAWSRLPEVELDAWAALPVALYSSHGDGRIEVLRRAQRYLQTRHPQSLAARLTVGTLWPGYWCGSNGWFADPRGTARLRETFEAARPSNWLTITTWNAYSETLHIEPSLGFGTGRLDLVHALLSEWRGGGAWPTDDARIYVTHPNEVELGQPFRVEVLGLLSPGTRAPVVTLAVCAADGLRVATQRVIPGQTRLWAAACQFGLETMPAGRWVRLCASDGEQEFEGIPIPVWPAGYHGRPVRCGTQWRLGEMRGGGPRIAIEREGRVPMHVRVTWPGAPDGAFVHLRHNFMLIHYPQANATEFTCDLNRTYLRELPSETFLSLPEEKRWGFFDAIGVGPDGMRYPSAPVWVAPPDGETLDVAGYWSLDKNRSDRTDDASPHRNWAGLSGTKAPRWVPDGARGGCLRFDGESSRMTPPWGIFPVGQFTLEMYARPEPQEGATNLGGQRTLFADVNGSLVLSLCPDGRVEACRAKPGGTARVVSPWSVPFRTWSRITVAYDLAALWLFVDGKPAGSVACEGERASSELGVGYNPFDGGSAYFRGCIDEVRLEGICRLPGTNPER